MDNALLLQGAPGCILGCALGLLIPLSDQTFARSLSLSAEFLRPAGCARPLELLRIFNQESQESGRWRNLEFEATLQFDAALHGIGINTWLDRRGVKAAEGLKYPPGAFINRVELQD